MKRTLLLCCLVAGAVLYACKQAEGERCQVDADCAEHLVCNKAKNTCQSTSGGDLDANIPDGPPIDAAIDAPDATPIDGRDM